MNRLALWKQQGVPFVKRVLELIRKYTKDAIRKAIADEKVKIKCNFTDQLLAVPPLSYMITHKGVISASSKCDQTDWLYISVDCTCSFLNLKLV